MLRILMILALGLIGCGEINNSQLKVDKTAKKIEFQGCRPSGSECRYSFPCDGRRIVKLDKNRCPAFGDHEFDKIACFCAER